MLQAVEVGGRSRRQRRFLQALAAAYVLLGGSIFVALIPTLKLGALAAGLLVVVGLVMATGLRSKIPRGFGILAAYSFAFLLLMAPVFALAAEALWGSGY